MNIDQKLTAIRDVIQQDVGNRGLARDPNDNLLTRTREDFANACASIGEHSQPSVAVVTGFFIPTATPPGAETDGPLGTLFLARAFETLGIWTSPVTGEWCWEALLAGRDSCGLQFRVAVPTQPGSLDTATHAVAVERAGPNHTWDSFRNHIDRISRRHPELTNTATVEEFMRIVPASKQNRCLTMRGLDITPHMGSTHHHFEFLADPKFQAFADFLPARQVTIGIGDGGNEIGMGRIPWEVIRRNIPNGGLIACRVPTDHLIVAGVSNWGAYALAAGVALLRGVELPAELFDPDREREILQVMVEKGPLVDGVTGKQTATVDGLSWNDYIKPLVEIGKIVKG